MFGNVRHAWLPHLWRSVPARRLSRPSRRSSSRLGGRGPAADGVPGGAQLLATTSLTGAASPLTHAALPGLARHHRTQRDQPSRDGNGTTSNAFTGEVDLIAGDVAPGGWAFCDGQRFSLPSVGETQETVTALQADPQARTCSKPKGGRLAMMMPLARPDRVRAEFRSQ